MIPAQHAHDERTALAGELHARPFQQATLPGRAFHIAFLPGDGQFEDAHRLAKEHLLALLDHHNAPHPQDDASHHLARLGPLRMKWERHTEFVSYTFYEDTPTDRPFSSDITQHLDKDWIEQGPGSVIAAIMCEFIEAEDQNDATRMLGGTMTEYFANDSLACSQVLDGNAIAMSDFQVHAGGWTRFAIVVFGETGPRRLGRLSQRLTELEVYRTLAMLALPIARSTMARLTEIERELATLIGKATKDMNAKAEAAMLNALTLLSADIESLFADSAFRFGSARAYDAIVQERIFELREERLSGRQLFREFMSRRFGPAMRMVFATEGRLASLSERAARGAELLRTRVNVTMEAQNQDLLETMNDRAAMQLRLQQTVEGLSVVAVSYYATSLGSYILAPFAKFLSLDKTTLTAAIAIPVVIVVFIVVKIAGRRHASKRKKAQKTAD